MAPRPALLYYVGKVGGVRLTQFELRVQVMTAKGANSGIYFLTGDFDVHAVAVLH